METSATFDRPQDCLPICLLFPCETGGEVAITSKVTWSFIPNTYLNLSNPGSSYMKTALVSIEVIAVLGGRSQVIVIDPNESIDSFKSHSNSPGMAFCNGSSKLPAFVTVTSDIPL